MKDETERLLESVDISSLQEKTPDVDLHSVLLKAAGGEGTYDPLNIVEKIMKMVKSTMSATLPMMMRIVGIGILSAGISRTFAEHKTAKICDLISCMCAAMLLSAYTTERFAETKQSIQQMTDFTTALLPTLLAMMTACGRTRSAAGLQRLSLAATGGFADLFTGSLLNLLGCAAAMVLVNAVMEGERLKGLNRMLRNAVHWMVGVCIAVFMGCLTIQAGTGTHYDGIALRVAKYAVDKSVPIVGGLFKDASDTFVGSALLVRYALGVVGLAGLLSILAAPALKILCSAVGIRMCAVLLEPFGADRMCRMISGFADVLISVFVLFFGTALLNLAMVAAMMYTGMEFM